MGNRMGNIQPGAMPWLHRYVGNPILTGLLNLFFRTGVRDAHCGMRALRRDVLDHARPAHDRHGVRLRDGDPRLQGEPDDRRGRDRVPPARRRVEALELPRRLAPPALPARPQPDLPVHRARRAAGGGRRAGLGARARARRHPRAQLGHPRPDRRRAVHDHRHPGARARAVRARLRHVLHGRDGRLVRRDARALPARARPRCSAARSRSPASSRRWSS